MEVMKRSLAKTEDFDGHVVYTWLGKMRWLPHIGPAHLVVGTRRDHIIAVPINNQRKPTGKRIWLRREQIAFWCDAYEEFAAVQQLMADYRKAKSQADDKFAKALSQMSKKEVKPLSGVRARKRPTRPFYVPKDKKARHAP